MSHSQHCDLDVQLFFNCSACAPWRAAWVFNLLWRCKRLRGSLLFEGGWGHGRLLSPQKTVPQNRSPQPVYWGNPVSWCILWQDSAAFLDVPSTTTTSQWQTPLKEVEVRAVRGGEGRGTSVDTHCVYPQPRNRPDWLTPLASLRHPCAVVLLLLLFLLMFKILSNPTF